MARSMYLWEVVAEIRLFLQQRYQAVFDLKEDCSTGLDIFMRCAISFDCELVATTKCQHVS